MPSSDTDQWPEEDSIDYPRNGEVAYWLSYPLFVAVMAVLALGFVTTGIVLNLVERLMEWTRQLF